MKILSRKLFTPLGYGLPELRRAVVAIDGVTDLADPCSVGEPRHGELTARGAVRFPEKGAVAEAGDFLSFTAANQYLEHVATCAGPLDPSLS